MPPPFGGVVGVVGIVGVGLVVPVDVLVPPSLELVVDVVSLPESAALAEPASSVAVCEEVDDVPVFVGAGSLDPPHAATPSALKPTTIPKDT
jgi:hypothetical protein